MTVLKIAVVGAPHTGKSQLALALTGALKAAGREAVVAVADASSRQADLARYDLMLLMGLETLVEGKGSGRAPQMPAAVQQAADHAIRAALAHAAVPYRVLYGAGEERLAHALHAIEGLLQTAAQPPRPGTGPGKKEGAWVWHCDKCSDPQCEHKLLTDLLAQRGLGL